MLEQIGGDDLRINPKELAVVNFIDQFQPVHYVDIQKEFKISKPTVAKYLRNISENIEQISNHKVQLIRSKRSGIYFIGNTKIIAEILANYSKKWFPASPKDRQIYIVASLIFKNGLDTVAKFSNKLFVSRRTVEHDLKKVRKFIQENGGQLSNHNGILKITLPEKLKYPFMINIIHQYWGQQLRVSNKHNVTLPPVLKNFFNENTVRQIFKIVDQFLTDNYLQANDYEYESLIIYLVLQISTGTNSLQTLADFDDKEKETIELFKLFQNKLGFKFSNEQLIYLNNLIILIKTENDTQKITDNPKLKERIMSYLNNYDNRLINGLVQHLSGTIHRYKLGIKAINPYTLQIKQNFPLAFDQALDLGQKLSQDYKLQLDDNESAFIALYFQSFIERQQNNNPKIKVAIVCNTGLGTARLLEERLRQKMSNIIQITRILVAHDINHLNLYEDFIISTIPLENLPIPYILSSPFLTTEDENKIKQMITQIQKQHYQKNIFTSLIREDLIFILQDKSDMKKVLTSIGLKLQTKGLVKDNYGNSLIKREQISSTAVNKIALPHADPLLVKTPFIALIISPIGITWGQNTVNIAFIMGLNDSIKKQLRPIYHSLNEIISNPLLIKKIISSNSSYDILNHIKKGSAD